MDGVDGKYVLLDGQWGLKDGLLAVAWIEHYTEARSNYKVRVEGTYDADSRTINASFVLRTKPSSTTSGCSFVRSHHADAR